MNVVEQRLVGPDGALARFAATPNVGGRLTPRFLVMHYTAGRNAQESINWLCSRESRASAHLVIARDGTVTQLVPFDQVAWHAGASRWNGLVGLNQYSLGIELDNPGPVKKIDGRWRSSFGREYDDADVVTGYHKLDKVMCGWVTYPPAQLDAATELARLLVQRYGLEDVIRHEDIAPERKTDPGPAFPYESFRARVMSGIGAGRRFVTTTVLRIRQGPGTGFSPLAESPLAKDTQVEVREENGEWRRVEVLPSRVVGWVHSAYLYPTQGV